MTIVKPGEFHAAQRYAADLALFLDGLTAAACPYPQQAAELAGVFHRIAKAGEFDGLSLSRDDLKTLANYCRAMRHAAGEHRGANPEVASEAIGELAPIEKLLERIERQAAKPAPDAAQPPAGYTRSLGAG